MRNNTEENNIAFSIEYLDDDTKRMIASDVFRTYIESQVKKIPVDVLISSISYNEVWNMVDKELKLENRDLRQEVFDKVKQIIAELSAYNVFHSADYGVRETLGQKYLNEATEAYKQLVYDKVREHIEHMNLNHIDRYDVQEAFYEIVENKLFGEKEQNEL